jgi:hypothetical protein
MAMTREHKKPYNEEIKQWFLDENYDEKIR